MDIQFSPDFYQTVFETPRLIIRIAEEADAEFIFNLWTNPKVMIYVGFPQGLRITLEQIQQHLKTGERSFFIRPLMIVLKFTSEVIGQCKLGLPDENGVAETDIKLFPEFWGNKLGVETKRGLVDYLFAHTDCKIVAASPNINNIASIKMQEAVGGIRVEEGVYEFPEEMKGFTVPVPYAIYHVRREEWVKFKNE
jgi:RimJ/RimL family protein N-acetyltransferase